MRIKVGDTVYDSKDQPIMVILTDYDKKCISNMNPDCHNYCEYEQENFTTEEIIAWMNDQ